LIFCFEKKPGEIWKFRNNFEIQISVPNCFSYFIPVFLGGGRKASVTEMESLRAKVQEAYKNLKAKRREEMFEKTFGTGKRKFVQTNDFA
jgi:predicted Zn-dependent protease